MFAKLNLPRELQIDLYQPLSAEYIRALLKLRKNYLFASCNKAAQNAAMFYSILVTCKLKGIELFEWLKSLFEKLLDWKASQFDELL